MNMKTPTSTIVAILRLLGRPILRLILSIGDVVLFTIRTLICTFSTPVYFKNIIRQIVEIGFYSLPVVGLTTIFAGMVLVLQSYTGFSRLGAESAIPRIVAITLTRELGPVLTGLMIAGRISSSIAAEIGSMKVTEQIDALISISVNPIRYLVVPRIIAAVLILPVLVGIGDILGIMGGYVISVYQLDFNSEAYLRNTLRFISSTDVISGLTKASCFGFIITIMGSYHGFVCRGGAQGVGNAATLAVVSASIAILLSNFILTSIFF